VVIGVDERVAHPFAIAVGVVTADPARYELQNVSADRF
jgi:hypothetical protein